MNFCQTTYAAKQELGCALSPRSNLLSHTSVWMRTPLRVTLPWLQAPYRRRNGL